MRVCVKGRLHEHTHNLDNFEINRLISCSDFVTVNALFYTVYGNVNA